MKFWFLDEALTFSFKYYCWQTTLSSRGW
jgi:hypothetical protein